MALRAFERNNYFYGKLLDEIALRKEQDCFNGKRWLLNRLITGSGVVCGLEVVPAENGNFVIRPGVAIDEAGHEIIVPEETPVPALPQLDVGVDVCLAYREELAGPVPVRVPDCDSNHGCACGTLLEGFEVRVQEVPEGSAELEHPVCELADFLSADGATRHRQVCNRVRQSCPDAAEDTCVRLARITQEGEGFAVELCDGIATVYSHPLLYELILCLADHVAALERGYTLRIVSGDRQSASAGDGPELVVEVRDDRGNPVSGVPVEFRVAERDTFDDRRGEVRGGEPRVGYPLSPRLTRTDPKGLASTRWKLASRPKEQHVIARAVGSAMTVTFTASVVSD